LVIGGGPAGISAGIWCADLGLSAAILEQRPHLGGQLGRIYNPITNYPGVETSCGAELRDRFTAQLGKTSAEVRLDVNIRSVDVSGRAVSLETGETLTGDALIIATGVRRRKLGVPGEDAFQGSGILESGAKSKNEVAGKHVVIIGGGDAAVENALILSEKAELVSLVHRRDRLTARREFTLALRQRRNIRVIYSSVVSGFFGDRDLHGLTLRHPNGGTEEVNCDLALIRVGVEPNSDLVQEQLALDKAGYIMIDQQCRTSVDDVYAVGDVASHSSPTISTAVGTAATAVKMIADKNIRKSESTSKK
jgi:thioredoxin reductase (NADPH)